MNAVSDITVQQADGALEIFGKTYSPAALFVPGACDPLIERIKAEIAKEVFDPSTEEGRKYIKSKAFQVTKSKTAIDAARVALVGAEKKRLAAIDAEGKRIWEALEAFADQVRKPVTEFENREKDRIAGHEARLAELKALEQIGGPAGLPPLTDDLARRLEEVRAFDISEFEEFKTIAANTKAQIVETMTARLAASQKADADRAELERLRAESEERAREDREAEIAAKAKAEAEEAARQREQEAQRLANEELARAEHEKQAAIDAAARAEEDRLSAERRAKEAQEQAERDRITSEQRAEQQRIAAEAEAKRREEEAAQRERDRQAAEKRAEEEAARKREADRSHKSGINREILASLMANPSVTITEVSAKSVISAIAKGEIPHVRIQY